MYSSRCCLIFLAEEQQKEAMKLPAQKRDLCTHSARSDLLVPVEWREGSCVPSVLLCGLGVCSPCLKGPCFEQAHKPGPRFPLRTFPRLFLVLTQLAAPAGEA